MNGGIYAHLISFVSEEGKQAGVNLEIHIERHSITVRKWHESKTGAIFPAGRLFGFWLRAEGAGKSVLRIPWYPDSVLIRRKGVWLYEARAVLRAGFDPTSTSTKVGA